MRSAFFSPCFPSRPHPQARAAAEGRGGGRQGTRDLFRAAQIPSVGWHQAWVCGYYIMQRTRLPCWVGCRAAPGGCSLPASARAHYPTHPFSWFCFHGRPAPRAQPGPVSDPPGRPAPPCRRRPAWPPSQHLGTPRALRAALRGFAADVGLPPGLMPSANQLLEAGRGDIYQASFLSFLLSVFVVCRVCSCCSWPPVHGGRDICFS